MGHNAKEHQNFHLSPWSGHWKITFKPRSHSVCLNFLMLLLVLPLKAAAAIFLPTSERQVLLQMYVILLAKNCMCLEKSFGNHKRQLSISTVLQLSGIHLCGYQESVLDNRRNDVLPLEIVSDIYYTDIKSIICRFNTYRPIAYFKISSVNHPHRRMQNRESGNNFF